MNPIADNRRLVADVGGTNSRLALYDELTGTFSHLTNFDNIAFQTFEAVIHEWLLQSPQATPDNACLAIAAPPSAGRAIMQATGWSICSAELKARFGFRQCRWINDFVGNAYSLPHLTTQDYQSLSEGSGGGGTILATVGPGTGLGGATLDTSLALTSPRASEPGHMSISPGNELEFELFALLLQKYNTIYAELLVSGPGLQRLHNALAEILGKRVPARSPQQISTAATDNSCKVSQEALKTFCALLGSICGDFILANGAYGGLYLAGGIAPKIIPFLEESEFLTRLCSKGKMQSHLEAVPVRVITTPQPGLIGAANVPL